MSNLSPCDSFRPLTSPQRTVHGPYRPTHYQGPRRPPPLALRSDASRSTTSLPSRSSPGPYYGGYGPSRSRTPGSPFSWTPRPPYRQRASSADQSTRSASLTSIVEMYQRPTTASAMGPPQRSPGSFYYDYSEGFEKQVPPAVESRVPLCPIPQRIGSSTHPMVLREETRVHLDAVTPDLDSEEAYEPSSNGMLANVPPTTRN